MESADNKEDEKKQVQDHRKELTKWWLICLSIVNVLLFVAYMLLISIKFPADYCLDFDYYSILIGVLSIFITFLVGWNIYSAVDIKNEVSEIKIATADKFDEQYYEIEQRHYYTEGKAATSLMEVFLRIKDSLPTRQNDNLDVPPIDYYIVYYGLISIANQQKSDTYNFSDNLLEKLIQYIKEKPFTLKEEYFKEIMQLYHQLSSNDSKRYRDLYRLLITLEEVK